MKRLILIKQSPAVQLGHLYEHIFCAHVDTFLYKHHLFPRLDYSLDGKMYHSGIIYIDIELYTEAAIALSDAISTLSIILNEELVTTVATQILAEKEEPLASTGYGNVKRALEALHEQPWRSADDIEIIDTKNIRKKTGPFYIAEGKARPARKLTTNILLDPEFAMSHRELLPLHRQFAWLIFSTLQSTLPGVYGYYSFNDEYKNTKKIIGLLATFKVADADDIEVNLPDTLETCLQIVRDLQQYDAFGRYMDELRTVSHYDSPDLAPSLEKNYEDTNIFIGSKGWQKIATRENYGLLLEHMSIEVKFGRDKLSQTLAR